MQVEIILLVFVAFITTTFAVNLLKKINWGDRKQVYLFCLTSAQLLWTLSIIFTLASFDKSPWNLLLSRSSFAAGMLIALAFYLLSIEFYKPKRRIILPFTVISYCIFWIIISFTSLLIKRVEVIDGRLVSHVGEFHVIYSLSLVCVFAYSLYCLLKRYNKAENINIKIQLKYIFSGALVSITLSVISNLIVPLIGYEVRSLGPIFMLFFIGATFYAITRHRFLKINLALIDLFVISVLSCIPFFYFFIAYEVNTRIWGSIYAPPSYLMGIGESFLFIFGFLKLQSLLNNFIDKYLRYKYVEIIREVDNFKLRVAEFVEVEGILSSVERVLKNYLKVQRFAIVEIYRNKATCLMNCGTEVDSSSLAKIKKVMRSFESSVLDVSEVKEYKDKSLYQWMNINSYEVIYRLSPDYYLILYSRNDSSTYTDFDITSIASLAETLGLALQRSRLYKQQKEFNEILKAEIEAATKEINRKKDQLQEKYQYEKDMLGIMGHELRTPITVAKGMSELMITKIDSKTVDLDYFKDKMQKIHDSILKEADLIQLMLSTSHVDNHKVNLQVLPVDLLECVRYGVAAFKKDAESKGLELYFEPPGFKVPVINSDSNRIQEVINNLVSNAVKYTNAGHIRVFITKEQKNIIINVEDTGIGIPDNETVNIGKKFYRIHQHLDKFKDVVRGGGTGLGLYVVKGVLKALGGELRVASTVGKGSTFSAVFPINANLKEDVLVTDYPVDKADLFEQLGLKINEPLVEGVPVIK